jgi:hypothetical protein
LSHGLAQCIRQGDFTGIGQVVCGPSFGINCGCLDLTTEDTENIQMKNEFFSLMGLVWG